MEKLRRLVALTMQRARIAQELGAAAQRRSGVAQAKAVRALDWIRERNEAALRRGETSSRVVADPAIALGMSPGVRAARSSG